MSTLTTGDGNGMVSAGVKRAVPPPPPPPVLFTLFPLLLFPCHSLLLCFFLRQLPFSRISLHFFFCFIATTTTISFSSYSFFFRVKFSPSKFPIPQFLSSQNPFPSFPLLLFHTTLIPKNRSFLSPILLSVSPPKPLYLYTYTYTV